MQILPTGQKKAAISPKNNDKKLFQNDATVGRNQNMKKIYKKISQIKLFINQYEQKGIIFYQNEDQKIFEKCTAIFVNG